MKPGAENNNTKTSVNHNSRSPTRKTAPKSSLKDSNTSSAYSSCPTFTPSSPSPASPALPRDQADNASANVSKSRPRIQKFLSK